MESSQYLSVLVHNRVHDLVQRVGDIVRLRPMYDEPTVSWADVERWRPRASFHRFGDAPWRDGPAARTTSSQETAA